MVAAMTALLKRLFNLPGQPTPANTIQFRTAGMLMEARKWNEIEQRWGPWCPVLFS